MSLSDPLFEKPGPRFYSEIAGPLVANYVPLTNVAQELYRRILAILDKHDIGYFLFAGSLVGYVRDGQMPPWLDDIDVILFEDQIEKFEQIAIPELERAGFVSYPPIKFPEGGRHILGLRETPRRDAFAFFQKKRRVRIPRAQLDVFYTRVTEDGILENLGNWGLYHRKKVPVEWVTPGQMIDLMGRQIRTFSNIEQDVAHEYGDVHNKVVVYSHGRRFLELPDTPWEDFAADFARNENAIKNEPVGRGTSKALKTYKPGLATVKADPGLSFVDILKDVITAKAGTVILPDADQWFWVPDLKKVCLGLKVVLFVENDAYLHRAVHMLLFADAAYCATPELKQGVQDSYKTLAMATSTDKVMPYEDTL